jgi:hypothetical protein
VKKAPYCSGIHAALRLTGRALAPNEADVTIEAVGTWVREAGHTADFSHISR